MDQISTTVIPKVLVLGSYPCVKPMHGGQIRLAEILEAYRQAGFQVQSINLYGHDAAAGQPHGPHDMHYPTATPYRQWNGRAIPLIDDLTSGQYIAGDEDAYRAITEYLAPPPDIIHLEQPWLLPLVRRWRDEGRIPGSHIIYGSQNIEAPLKNAILRQYGIAESEQIASDIAQLEAEACRMSDIVLAVSESDRRTLAQLSDTPTILAANGISAWHPHPSHLEAWKKKLPPGPFALFVGSAHPPNISGFFDILGDSLGFLAPDQRICVVGSVGPHLPEHPAFQRWRPINESRIQILGMLDDADLAAVKSLAHLFILPIAEGGGSNIKTAEALYSGKYVLGTPTSFRGFDEFMSMPGVNLAQTPEDFRKRTSELLYTPALAADPHWQEAREHLLWKNTLRPMIQGAQELMRTARKAKGS